MRQTTKIILDAVQKLYDDIDNHKNMSLEFHDIYVWLAFQGRFKKAYLALDFSCETKEEKRIVNNLFEYFLITSMTINNYFEFDKYFN